VTKFSVDRLREVTDVYFHEACPDGSASAFICAAAFHALHTKPKFWSLQYGTELMNKLEPRPGQLFVDITPPKDRWEEWKAVKPIVLDHHATVKDVTEGLDGVYATNEKHSGAMLAFEEVFMAAGISDPTIVDGWQNLAQLAMIRDTWKKDSPQWRNACAMAMAMLFEGSRTLVESAQRDGVEALLPDDFKRLMNVGHKLVGDNERRMEKVAGSAYRETYSFDKEYKAAYFNCTEKIISDVANYLIDGGCNIAVGYFYLFEDGSTRMVASIRTDGSLSAKKIAEAHGGGGHDRAAGFRLSNGDTTPPYRLYAVVSETIVNLLIEADSTKDAG
jgi:hypothetical protein